MRVSYQRIAALSTALLLLACSSRAQAALPIRFAPSYHIGWEINGSSGANICTVTSKDNCRHPTVSSEPGGFDFPGSVAIDPRSGNLYVADISNDRIQELTATGEFIAMFGWDVNETKDRSPSATQAEKDLCTAASGDKCGAGIAGTRAEQIYDPTSVVADPNTGNIYVTELGPNEDRVDEYTADGRFVWMVGKDVNKSQRDNICTEREIRQSGVRCGAGAEAGTTSDEPASFKFESNLGNLLADGGPEDLLYVGGEHRVQEFEADGKWKREILLASISAEHYSNVSALAVDPDGDIYLVYSTPGQESGSQAGQGDRIRKLAPDGELILEFPVDAIEPDAPVSVAGIAVDAAGQLAVIGTGYRDGSAGHLAMLYDGDTGHLISEFVPPSDFDGLTFNNVNDMYIAATDRAEVAIYTPAPLLELVTSPSACEIGASPAPFAVLNCAMT